MIPINSKPTRVARDLALWRAGKFAARSPEPIRSWRIRRLMRALSRNNRHEIEHLIAVGQDGRDRDARSPLFAPGRSPRITHPH
jgi:hypothetical protein